MIFIQRQCRFAGPATGAVGTLSPPDAPRYDKLYLTLEMGARQGSGWFTCIVTRVVLFHAVTYIYYAAGNQCDGGSGLPFRSYRRFQGAQMVELLDHVVFLLVKTAHHLKTSSTIPFCGYGFVTPLGRRKLPWTPAVSQSS